MQEVTDLVEEPNILSCKFDKKFLDIPQEILIITMQHHQKYFHTFDNKGNITNEFFVVANNKDKKGYIKSCLLYTSPSPRDLSTSRMPSSA